MRLSTCRSQSLQSSRDLLLIVLYAPDGLIGQWIEPLGFRVVYALPGMVLASLFVTLPFVVREVAPVLRELGERARGGGGHAGRGAVDDVLRVTLPSIRWGVAYGVTLTVARSIGEFGALLVVSGNILGRTQTATLYVHDTIDSFRPEGAFAVSVVLAGVSFLFLIIMEAVRRRHGGTRREIIVMATSPLVFCWIAFSGCLELGRPARPVGCPLPGFA